RPRGPAQHRYAAGRRPLRPVSLPLPRRRGGAGDRRPRPAAQRAEGRGMRITALRTHDIRFPTSRELDGSDAMNPDPDYSAAYVVLRTDEPSDLCGHGFVFTIGRGNDVQTSAYAALRHLVVGRKVSDIIC